MKTLYHFRSDWLTADGPADLLFIYSSTRSLDVQQIRDVVDKEVQKGLRPDEMIILVRADIFDVALDSLTSTMTLGNLKGRLGEGCGIAIWGFDATGAQSRDKVLQQGARSASVDLGQIVRRGGTAIFNEHKGFVEGSETYHFRNPSGKHTDRFIRLSNILVRQAEISFLALALLPHIPLDADISYIDTPSLYAILAAASDHRDQGGDGTRLSTDNFRSYFGLNTHQFTDFDRSVAIVSASSSGSMAARLAERGFAPDRIVHLLYLGASNSNLKVAIDLSMQKQVNPEGHAPERRTFAGGEACELCNNGSLLIELRGDQFDVSPPQPRALVVRQKHAPDDLSDTMQRVVGSRALSVSTRDFHRIDFGAAVTSAAYQRRLNFYFRRFLPAKPSHCVVLDEASRPLADLAQDATSDTYETVHAYERGEIEKKIKDATGPILVIAGAIGNGRSLLDVSRELRTAAPEAPISYFVGFARPESVERRRTLKNSLVFCNKGAAHGYQVVDELILPSGARENAWARELDFLNATRSKWPASQAAFVGERIDELSNNASPLIDNLFVSNSKDSNLVLRPGFAFWPEKMTGVGETQADVFTTISSVLQNLRTRPSSAKEEALRSGWFRQTLIDPEVFGRFNDGIIQAAFLRAALPSELDYRSEPALSLSTARLIAKMLEGAKLVRGEGAFEFLLALGCGRLRLRNQDMPLVLKDSAHSRPRVRSLQSIVRARQVI